MNARFHRYRRAGLVLASVAILVISFVGGAVRPAAATGWPFSYSPSNPMVGQQITFTTGCYGQPPCTYSWNFGDGVTSSNGPVVYHTYSAVGTYTVTLSGQDSLNAFGQTSQTVTVVSCDSIGLDFSFSPLTPLMDQPVTFTSTRPASCSLYWVFGDGAANGDPNNQVVSHAFSAGGPYSVSLRSMDALGNPISKTRIITIGYGECIVCDHRPSQSFDYTKNRLTHPFKVSNSQTFPNGSPAGAVGLGLAVEVLSYSYNFDNANHDRYTLAIIGSANSRLAHQYSGPSYSSSWDLNQCPGDIQCKDLGINQLNGGVWLSLGSRPFYYYGHPYNQVFICSNGYIAFVYSQTATTCPSSTQKFPSQALDSNGNILNIPDAVIAPMWKPLDASAAGAHIYYQPSVIKYRNPTDPRFPVDSFGITWSNLQTVGTSYSNTFSLSFDSTGNIYFSYPSSAVNPADTKYTPIVGIEDASGTLSTISDAKSAISNGGVLMNDPFYVGSPPNSISRPDWNYDYLQQLELRFSDQTPGDGAALNPTGNPLDLYGSNLQFTNPSLKLLKDDPKVQLLSQIVEGAVIGVICLPLPSIIGCFILGAADTVYHNIIDPLRQAPTVPPAPLVQTMTNSIDGYLRAPIQQQDNLCGYGFYSDGVTPFHGCSSDATIFDVVDWEVPSNTAVLHKLSISVGVAIGTTYCCIDFSNTAAVIREGATVTLKIDPGDFSVSASSPSPSVVLPGSSLTSSVTVTSLNYLQTTVSLTPPPPANGITVTPNPVGISLTATKSGLSTITIQTTSSTPPGSYTLSIGATDPSGGVSHAISISFNVADFAISAAPNPLNTFPATSASWTITIGQKYGFTGTVSLTDSVSTGLTCLALNPASVTLTSTSTSATSTLSCSGPSGSYLVLVTGNSGPLAHNITLTFNATPDFSLCCSSSFSLPAGGAQLTTGTNVNSLGFSGTVNMVLSTTLLGDSTVSLSPTSVTLSPGQTTSSTLSITSGSQTGTYSFTITGTSGNLFHTLTYSLTISPCCSGGGSVASGTLITLTDGSQIPVQNLKVGNQMLGYDTATGNFRVSLVKTIVTVTTYDMLVIHTGYGAPYRTDANPHQTLWVKTSEGSVSWLPVTEIRVGDYLFTPDGWVIVTSIDFIPMGNYTMYDIIASIPYFANGYLDPVRKL